MRRRGKEERALRDRVTRVGDLVQMLCKLASHITDWPNTEGGEGVICLFFVDVAVLRIRPTVSMHPAIPAAELGKLSQERAV